MEVTDQIICARIGNLELKTCGTDDLHIRLHSGTNSCVIARWVYDDDSGYSLKLCNARPFCDTVDNEVFWLLAEVGQKALALYLKRWPHEREEYE